MSSTRSLRILCVDNDPDIRLILEISLHLDSNIFVFSVSCAADAISALAEKPFDLVILDAALEAKSRTDLLKKITKTDGSPPTPVILLSSDTSHNVHLNRPGIIGVITKPFDPITLASVVRSQIEAIT